MFPKSRAADVQRCQDELEFKLNNLAEWSKAPVLRNRDEGLLVWVNIRKIICCNWPVSQGGSSGSTYR